MTNKNVTTTTNENRNSYLAAFKDMENRFEHMFHNMWNNPFHHEMSPDIFSFSTPGHMPNVDVVDREKEIVVKAEIPGFDKKDLDITIANGHLVIKAKACKEEKEEEGDYLRREIRKSETYRSVLLPAEVDEENIKTSYRNGVLKLTMTKQQKAQRKQIKVE